MLADVNALPRVMPQLVWNGRLADLVDAAHACGLPLPSRFAILCFETPDAEALSRHLRVPNDCLDYARLLRIVRDEILGLTQGKHDSSLEMADRIVSIIERCDGIRKPERFMDLVRACACMQAASEDKSHGSGSMLESFWRMCLDRARETDAGAIAREYAGQPRLIKDAVRRARVESVYEYLVQS